MNKHRPISFAFVFLLFNFDVALGCQCVGNTTVPEALEKAKVVFSGEVIAEEIIKPEKDIYGLPAAKIELVMTRFKVGR